MNKSLLGRLGRDWSSTEETDVCTRGCEAEESCVFRTFRYARLLYELMRKIHYTKVKLFMFHVIASLHST